MKKLSGILCFILGLAACGNAKTTPKEKATSAAEKPSILVIGDSISIGSTPWLRKDLSSYEVLHNPGNAYSSSVWLMGGNIDSWLGVKDKFEAIIFNACLHDVFHVPHEQRIEQEIPQRYVLPEDYRTNLMIAAKKIKLKTDHPLFVLGTWIPSGAEGGGRTVVNIQAYNQIAQEVMDEMGIPTVDLYSISELIPHLYEDADAGTNAHFTSEGSRVLAHAIEDELKIKYGIK